MTSGKKYWSDGTLVAGQQFEYMFDAIGNRQTAGSGGDPAGSNLRYQTYTPHYLNQYSARAVPGYLQMIGSASPSSRVGLWSINGLYTITSRKSDYFWGELQFNNASGPLYPIITNLAILDSGSNPDISSSSTRTNYIPMTPESFVYDLDGNLTSDARWNYTWDAENRLTKIESLTGAPSGSKRRLEFAYDHQGRRIWVKVTNLDSSQVLSENKFLYDAWNVSVTPSAT